MTTPPVRPWPPSGDTVLRALEDADARGWLHVRDVDTGQELGYRANERVVIASIAKIPLVLALYREAEAGRLDLTLPRPLPADSRTAGLTGLSVMQDAAFMSLRDLAYLALAVSDNAAADVVLEAVGLQAVADALQSLGLVRTQVLLSMQAMVQARAHEVGLAGSDAASGHSDHRQSDQAARGHRFDVLDPKTTNCSTAAETTALLAAIWRDEAATPESCSAVRRLMGLQVWPHRLTAGFPADDIRVSGKTGTLLGLRHEVGVVEYPDGHRYAVAVYTQSASRASHQPHVDAAIGRTAHLLVTQLRLGGGVAPAVV